MSLLKLRHQIKLLSFLISFKHFKETFYNIFMLFSSLLNKRALKDGSGRHGDESKCNILK